MSRNRVIVAIILLVLALGAIASGGLLLAIFIGLFMYVGIGELVKISQAKGVNPSFHTILFSCYVLLALASFELYEWLFPAFSVSMIISFLAILSRGNRGTMSDVSMTMLAIVYAGVLPIHIVMTRNLGLGYVLLMLLVIASTDIFAYFSGKLFGRTPLWKEVSPKKTIEGSIGGTIAALIAAVIVGHFYNIGLIHSLIAGLLISFFGQIGDLNESMLKRDVGIKDSGNVFPGHGGVLDRTDSYIFTGIVAYYYFKYLVVG